MRISEEITCPACGQNHICPVCGQPHEFGPGRLCDKCSDEFAERCLVKDALKLLDKVEWPNRFPPCFTKEQVMTLLNEVAEDNIR